MGTFPSILVLIFVIKYLMTVHLFVNKQSQHDLLRALAQRLNAAFKGCYDHNKLPPMNSLEKETVAPSFIQCTSLCYADRRLSK